MTNQQITEIVKALAYGETAEQAAETEGVTVDDVQRVLLDHAAEIDTERSMLRKAGYLI